MDTGLTLDSHNLGDFLRIKDEDLRIGSSSGRRNSLSGLTLSAVLSDKRIPDRTVDELLPRAQSNRTLLDVLRDEQASQRVVDGKKSWRQFKEKFRLRRIGTGTGSTWTPTVPTPASDIPINNNGGSTRFLDSTGSTNPHISASPSLQRSASRGLEHTSSLTMRRIQREEEGETGEEVENHHPVRVSLMALLAETDRQMDLDGSKYMDDDEKGDGEVAEKDEIACAGKDFNNCCVCMVRHKGSAFIPCGHTFCRLCSRELLAQRGNCPLCNNYIVEILDIY